MTDSGVLMSTVAPMKSYLAKETLPYYNDTAVTSQGQQTPPQRSANTSFRTSGTGSLDGNSTEPLHNPNGSNQTFSNKAPIRMPSRAATRLRNSSNENSEKMNGSVPEKTSDGTLGNLEYSSAPKSSRAPSRSPFSKLFFLLGCCAPDPNMDPTGNNKDNEIPRISHNHANDSGSLHSRTQRSSLPKSGLHPHQEQAATGITIRGGQSGEPVNPNGSLPKRSGSLQHQQSTSLPIASDIPSIPSYATSQPTEMPTVSVPRPNDPVSEESDVLATDIMRSPPNAPDVDAPIADRSHHQQAKDDYQEMKPTHDLALIPESTDTQQHNQPTQLQSNTNHDTTQSQSVDSNGAYQSTALEEKQQLVPAPRLQPSGAPFLLGEPHPEHVGRKCLVLDLDETLVHSSFKALHESDFIIPVEIEGTNHNVYVIKRPGVDEFMKAMGKLYEVVVFTASVSKYGDPLLDALDINKAVHHRLFRESCHNHQGNYIKNLDHIGRPLNETIIIDNSPTSYLFHPQHALPISSWFSDAHDNELLDLIPVLTDLSKPSVQDVSMVLNVQLSQDDNTSGSF